MQTITQTFEYPVVYSGPRTALWSFNKERLMDISLGIIAFLGDCLIGIVIGSIAGWISGWCIALMFQNLYEPVDFISFASVHKWYYLPNEYAGYGALIGAAAGVLVISAFMLMKMIRKTEQETDQNTVKEKVVS